METAGEDIRRPAIGVVSGVDDELIVEGKPRRGSEGVTVIGLDDLLKAGIRQLSVADDDTQSSGIQKGLVHAGNAVDDTGNADRIVGPAPLSAGDRDAA